MGKRKHQRVVLVSVLLFLTIVTCGILLAGMVIRFHNEKSRVMGKFITKHPDMEQELIDIFENHEGGRNSSDVMAGRNLEEKYGYIGKNGNKDSIGIKYMAAILLVITISSVFIIIILIYFERRQNLQKEEEEKIREQLKESEEGSLLLLDKLRNEEKKTKELITDISHQLKTPLASLKMSYEIAQSEDFTIDERKEFYKQCQEEINKLESLLETLLNLARLETDMIRIKPSASGIRKTLVYAVNSVYMKALGKKIDIVMEDFKDLPVLHDTKWTQEAFVNVLDNAIKYSNSNTTIRFNVTSLVTYVMIKIADEGIGIPVKDYPNIFKRFYRGSSDAAQHTEGSGVGLYL
jgi:signal transduction histidine kinase